MSSAGQKGARRPAAVSAATVATLGALGYASSQAFAPSMGASAARAGIRGAQAASLSEAQGAGMAAQPMSQAFLGQSTAAAAAVLGAAGMASRRRIGRAGGRSSDRIARQALFPWDNSEKKTVIITGASSGLGLNAAKALVESGKWFVIMACKDFTKGEKVAREMNFPKDRFQVMHCDLAANNSVRNFVQGFRALNRSLDCLVCNAAVYFPNAHKQFPVSGGGPRWSADGHELSFAANYLGHFLLTNLLLEDLKKAPKARCIILGTVTATVNGKELGGMVPPLADLGDLSGLEKGMQQPITMIDGGKFDGAKAYKDSKVCDVMMMRELHKRFHAETGVSFMSLYPGCIAETNLFREHYPIFQTLFPAFHKTVTRAYVSQEEAGRRLASVVSEPEYNESGSYYSWQGASGTGGSGGAEAKDNKEKTTDFFLNEGSFRTLKVEDIGGEAGDWAKSGKLWDLSEKMVGLKADLKAKAPEPSEKVAA